MEHFQATQVAGFFVGFMTISILKGSSVKKKSLYKRILALPQNFYVRHLRVLDIVYFKRQKPVIVFTMGKVGSSSIVSSIPEALPHFHIHTMMPDRIAIRKREENNVLHYRGEQIREHITRRNYPANYIIMVRNPIDRNLSTFFQRFKYYTGVHFRDSQHRSEELMQVFKERFEHERPLSWFDDEIKTFLGFDVYQHEFPREQGYLQVQHRNADILLMKLEIPDAVKESAIAGFLNLSEFHLENANLSEEKEYAEAYSTFKKQIVLSENYINQMLDSKYTRHFYTEEEIAKSREKWRSRLRSAAASKTP